MSEKRSKGYEHYLDTADKVLRNIAGIVEWIKSGGIERTRDQLRDLIQFLGGLAVEGQKDPFRILGVDPEASREEVDEVFRTKARFAHPDIVGGSGERMSLLNWARDEIYKLRGWK